MRTLPYHILMLITFIIAWLPTNAAAQANITVTIKAEKEIIETENGKEVKKVVEASDILPGEVITYTLNFQNIGDETAQGVAISNHIPLETTYVLGSATETGTDVTFSIDNGKSYKKPSLLTYERTNPDGTTEKRLATPEQYTHVRWIVPKIEPNEKGSVSFKTRIK